MLYDVIWQRIYYVIWQRDQVDNSIVLMANTIDTVWFHNPIGSICCALGKGTLQIFFLLGNLSKQLYIFVTLLKKINEQFNRTEILRSYLVKHIGVIT